MKFLFLEPFYGGSHKDFADGLVHFSRHTLDLATLPPRFWKWRMRGAALHFAQSLPLPTAYDGLFVTNLMSLSDLRALWSDDCPPTLLYLHENQLSYPLPAGENMDYQFGFTDITSALSADRVLFNSAAHRTAFLDSLPRFLAKMPEFKPLWVTQILRERSGVLYPGCDFRQASGPKCAPEPPKASTPSPTAPPLIIWNHRWEFDKRPELFFDVLDGALKAGYDFRLALLGQNFQAMPQPFLTARERYGSRIVRFGYVPDKHQYYQWLQAGDIVISTAIQENFGIAIVEAVRHGCLPLLPNSLSYPELIPPEYHRDCLYEDEDDLHSKLCAFLACPTATARARDRLAAAMQRFAWPQLIAAYDCELARLASLRSAHRAWQGQGLSEQ